MLPELFEALAQVFADIQRYNTHHRLVTDYDGHQRTRYVQRTLFLLGYSEETVKALMDRADELAKADPSFSTTGRGPLAR